MLKSGFYQTDITPALGTNMPGYFHRRPVKTIFDNLYVTAWVIDDGARRIAIASVDAVWVEREHQTAIKTRVQEACGIPVPDILIAATHTHTGGSTVVREYFGSPETEYIEFLIKRTADCITMAARNVSDCELSFGAGELTGHSYCRIFENAPGSISSAAKNVGPHKPKPYTEIDYGFTVIDVRRNGKTAGVVVNWANHCDTVGRGIGASADYPGKMREILKERFGADCAVLFLQGACGNVCHVNKLDERTFVPGQYVKIGTALAGEAIKSIENAEPQRDPAIGAETLYLAVTQRLPAPEQLAWADGVNALPGGSDSPEDKNFTDRYFARETYEQLKKGSAPVICDLQVIRIGELAIYTSPGELFNEYAREIKSRSPYPYNMIAAYANGYIGYITTPACASDDIYECRIKSGYTPEYGTGEKMTGLLLEAGNRLYKSK